jgi:uncharacterized protein YuzE
MIFEYYPETDMLYLKLADVASSESEEIAAGVVLDFDEQNQIVGIEIEDASKRIDLSHLELKALPITSISILERAPIVIGQ